MGNVSCDARAREGLNFELGPSYLLGLSNFICLF